MTAQTVSKAANRYATAFFELLPNNSSLEEAKAELRKLVDCIEANEALERSLRSPVFSREQKSELLGDISSKLKFSKTLSNFLGIIALNGRAPDIVAIHRAFEKIYAKKQGLSQVIIRTAKPMGDEERKKICEVVERKTGKDFVLTEQVDADLLGGIQMQIGSTLYDASIASKLDRLHNTMKGV